MYVVVRASFSDLVRSAGYRSKATRELKILRTRSLSNYLRSCGIFGSRRARGGLHGFVGINVGLFLEVIRSTVL